MIKGAVIKIFAAVASCLLIVVATFLSVKVAQEYLSSSWVLGKPVYHDVYQDFNIYEYDLSSDLFYINNAKNGYILNKSYPVKNDFNGVKNNYNMLINNTPCAQEKTTAGRYNAEFNLSFFNINGDVEQVLTLYIDIIFYQSKIEITISNNASAKLQGYLQEYIEYNGFMLRIIEGQYDRSEIVSKDYVVYWLDYDNSILSVGFYNQGEALQQPQSPTREGYIFVGWTPKIDEYVNKSVTYIATYNAKSGNLLKEPKIYDVTSNSMSQFGKYIDITDSDTFDNADFASFPYKVTVQILYYDNKSTDSYTVLQQADIITNKTMTVNDIPFDHAYGNYDFYLDNVMIRAYFAALNHTYRDGNDNIVIGDIDGASFSIYVYDNTKNAYFIDHIKFRVTNVETTEI